jgi:hypothetical protein
MIGSMTYEDHPHPLLDLSPLEQVVLLKAERDQLRCAVVQVSEGMAIVHLAKLGLIEEQDDAWVPTRSRGCLVAQILERLDHVRTTRRSASAPEKKAGAEASVQATLDELVAEVRALPFP